MSLTLHELDNKLSKNLVSSFYFIMGPEVFLIKESLRKIQSRILSPESLDFNYEVFCAGEVEMEKMCEAVETLPVFSTKRVVVCEEAHRLKESDWKTLKPIMNNPVETCVFVFVSSNPDKRKKVIKELLSFCEVILADTPKEAQWSVWLEWMGKKEGLSFSDSAVALIRDYACYDLLHLETEVKKLKSFLGSKKNISAEDVLNVLPRVRPENIFDLSKAIGQKNLSSALVCLARLLEDNHNEVGVLSLISRHIRILARIKEGVKKGHTEQTLCNKTGVPRFFIRNYIKESDLWTDQKLFSTIEILKATDKALKSSPVSAHIWLENFIIKTCSV
ncbi:MAG: DNA polymerase III subunit delta [Bdellovibrionales bacterium]|nr:DNA polymerase III subunit delta [Bdellovibrionales bacterium]